MPVSIFYYLFLVTLLSHNLASCETIDDEEPRRTFPFRRAIDGTRGRKFYEPEDDGFSRNYGSSGRYDPAHHENDFSDIRNNVPGEPGIDYPSYTRLPQTGFICEPDFRGYYADEVAGCQVFHVCDGSFLVSSFLCPVGSVFSQKLLTCDWWTKVDCSSTRNYHVINSESLVSEVDDDEILRKAFEMAHSAAERIPAETITSHQQQELHQDRRHRIVNAVTERYNDLQTYSDYPDYPTEVQSKFPSRSVQKARQRYSEDDYYVPDADEEGKESPIRVHTVGEDRRNDRTHRKNDFHPSYAPTVPTVITTTRRYYSPTFPTTTFRPSTERNYQRGRFDLEVESSDHLYKARGRSEHTIKAATAAPVPKIAPDAISLATLVNSAGVNSITEAETLQDSSQHKTTIALPSVENHTEPTDSVGKEVETLSVLTIDNENPDKFLYNHEPERKYDVSEAKDSQAASGFEKPDKLTAFLAPPQEDAPKFRITVLEDSSKNRQRAPKKDVQDEGSKSTVESLRSVEAPAIHITPPLLDGNEASRDSPVIRIRINEEIGRKPSGLSDVESYGNDYGALAEDSEGEHSETKISEVLPKERETVTKNLTSDSSFALDSHSIGIINAAVALEQSHFNAATETTVASSSEVQEEQKTGDVEKSKDLLASTKAGISEKHKGGDGGSGGNSEDVLSTTKATIASKQKSRNAQKSAESLLNDKSTISKKQNGGYSEDISSTTKATIAGKQKSGNAPKSEESLLNHKPTISEKQNGGIDQRSEEIVLSTEATIAEERSPQKSGEPLLSTKTEVPEEDNGKKSATQGSKSKNISDAQKSTTAEGSYLGSGTPKEKNTERRMDAAILSTEKAVADEKIGEDRSLSSKTVLDTTSSSIEESADKEDKEIGATNLKRRNIEDIDGPIAKAEAVDSIAAADYKSFEILRPAEPGAPHNDPNSDSRSPRRIYSGSEEDDSSFRSNNLQPRDYYRSIVALVNGPNLPRPFSLETPQNVEIRTPSDSSTTVSSASGTSGSEIEAVDRNPAQHPSLKHSEKFSASSSLELSDEKVLEQLDQNFGKRQLNEEKLKLVFELPEERRLLDFSSGRPLEEQQGAGRDDEENERLKTAQNNEEQPTVVETELIPSISFALNTEEEREEYMEAVMKGLLSDFRASESRNNDTSSVDS